ncbi:hypothetical protein [Leptolyngbya sp. FACHB-711]|uniref:hypothetical protein n=1 Tax=unclassified Leptolyngbya TaxID=2650499 RepID=UPI0016830E14|nr:hypothetical protein [Leptolyngbya sp. FACHB-711]MBD1851126.1 hypothetical protein [Cyanobacteria bacterium FACHB-502]MBD2023608.1 hypothetical protein [Leptolyngbya sp. FACHB-711]
MVQLAQSHQYPIKKFSDVQQGATALSALQDAGFSPERLALVPEALQSTPKLSQTEAAANAGKGAIAGTVLGAMAGFLIAALSLHDPASPSMAPFSQILTFTLIASGVGAAGGAAIAAITGGSVNKQAVADSTPTEQNFLLLMDGGTQEEVKKAQEILQQIDNNTNV